ncbi:MAG TPA: hypothetical protein DEU72_05520 [Desulfomicrobiaceae bacterium]|nr:hypothetical protein [Desulfomicrobiaceae bacterium]
MSKEIDKGILAVSPVPVGLRPPSAGETKAAPKRFWAQHKTEAVLRLLRGGDIGALSRELGVTAAKISQWRDTFLASGADGLKKRSPAEEAEYKDCQCASSISRTPSKKVCRCTRGRNRRPCGWRAPLRNTVLRSGS